MRFNDHSQLEGRHSFLSPSSYHWVNYDFDRLTTRFHTSRAALLGLEQHAYAAEAIALREYQMDETSTLGMYINDCIGFKMRSELLLYYSDNCFGTADAFAHRYNILRISDLKTGVSRTSEKQLEVYAAIYCLEYDIDPFDIRRIELRIYQNNECRLYRADPAVILGIMIKIVDFDQHLNLLRMEEEL